MNYYIFKTDNKTGRIVHICNGAHDDEQQCRVHWLCYLYGFMDGAFELLGDRNFKMDNGTHDQSFRLYTEDGQKDVEYFMLLDEEGQNMIQEICKTWEPDPLDYEQ